MATYKHAIVGFANMAQYHLRTARKDIPEMDPVAAYDIRPEARAAAEEAGLKAYPTLEALLADPAIDIVTVATPNNFHRDISVAALRAGKHVICEKPVAMNAAELSDIIAASEAAGRLFSVHQNRRWDPDFVLAHDVIKSGKLGDLVYIDSRVQSKRGMTFGWRGLKINGGGLLYDWGVHLIDQILWAVDSPVVELFADLHAVECDECDDNFKLILRFASGTTAQVQIDSRCFIPYPRWQIQGSMGTLRIESREEKGRLIRAEKTADTVQTVLGYDENGPFTVDKPSWEETIVEEKLPMPKTDWSMYYKNIIATLEGKEALIVKPAESLRVMRVIDAARRSAETGKSVSGPF